MRTVVVMLTGLFLTSSAWAQMVVTSQSSAHSMAKARFNNTLTGSPSAVELALLLVLGALVLWMIIAIRQKKLVRISIVALALCCLALVSVRVGRAMSAGRAGARAAVCQMNMKSLERALWEYVSYNNDTFPPAETWCDAIEQYVLRGRRNFVCPEVPHLECGYGFNANIGGKKVGDVRNGVMIFFESDGGWNAHGGPEAMIKQPRHTYYYLLVNGGCVNPYRAEGDESTFSTKASEVPWE